MTAKELLEQAKALIADEKNWTTGANARNRFGERVVASDHSACQFCALGAFSRIATEKGATRVTRGSAGHCLVVAACELAPERDVHIVNDFFGHSAVLQMYDRAIEMAAAEELVHA